MNYTKLLTASFGSLALAILLLGCNVDAGGSDPDDGQPSSGTDTSDIPSASNQQDYLAAINNARAVEQDCGTEGLKPSVPPLAWNSQLYAAALEHSNDMAKSNTFDHTGSGTPTDITSQDMKLGRGSTMRERVEHSGYQWNLIGENIAAGTDIDTSTDVINHWLASDGHCANLMSPNFTEVGMAMVENANADFIHYWTQNFAEPI